MFFLFTAHSSVLSTGAIINYTPIKEEEYVKDILREEIESRENRGISEKTRNEMPYPLRGFQNCKILCPSIQNLVRHNLKPNCPKYFLHRCGESQF